MARGSNPGKGKIFLSSTASRLALGPTQPQPPIQWVPGILPPWVKRQGREGDRSSPSSAKVKNGGVIPPLPHMSSWHNVELIKHRDNFTFYQSIFRLTNFRTIYYRGSGRVNCCWSSPVRSVLVSASVRTHDHILVLSKTFMCFEMGPPLRREEGSDYYWLLPLWRGGGHFLLLLPLLA
jgi:hypothetical protein